MSVSRKTTQIYLRRPKKDVEYIPPDPIIYGAGLTNQSLCDRIAGCFNCTSGWLCFIILWIFFLILVAITLSFLKVLGDPSIWGWVGWLMVDFPFDLALVTTASLILFFACLETKSDTNETICTCVKTRASYYSRIIVALALWVVGFVILNRGFNADAPE